VTAVFFGLAMINRSSRAGTPSWRAYAPG
jgi:hypothetical protein